MRYGWCGLIVVLALGPAHPLSRKHSPQKAHKRATAPPATSASEARKLFEAGLNAFENEHRQAALDNWRRAAQKDPRSPLTHLFISLATANAQEGKTERGRAQALAARAPKREKLLVRWLSGVEEEQYVPAIAAMNDLLASYPADKHVAFLAGRWLRNQEQYEAAIKQLRRATGLDSQYAAAWNQLAYCYAYSGDFSNAFAAMERYTTLLPKDANPQASYAEILRMAGNYRDALRHYRQALQIDPTFQLAQGGIADTYALMGEEATARSEYEKAMRQASTRAEQIRYAMQAALTYVREKKNRRAISGLDSAADQAQSAHLPLLEAEAFREMALIERDNQQSVRLVEKASAALAGAADSAGPEFHQERAEVLRLKALRMAATGNTSGAKQALHELEELANTKGGTALRRSYAGGMGGVLMVEQKYGQAIPYLEEDMGNPLSMRDLIAAYANVGSGDRGHVLELKLAAVNQPSVEQALVVPELRTKLAATKEKRGWLQKLMGRNP
jgi:tetratricopeptide (TPR) repeat protein